MATNKFATTFKSAVNRGTPATVAVQNIAKKSRKTEAQVWNALFNDGYVNRKKINGSFVYWPNFQPKTKPSNKNFKTFGFQQFVNWAIVSGYCTPEQVANLKTQKDFFNFFGPFFASQFGWNVTSGWTPAQVKKFAGSTNGQTKKSTGRKTRKNSKRKTGASAKRKNTRKRTAASKRRTTGRKPTRRASTTTGRKRSTAKRTTRRSTARKNTGRKATTSRTRKNTTRRVKGRRTTTRNYSFPGNTARSYRKAA